MKASTVTGPPGSTLAAWLDEGPQLPGSFATVVRHPTRMAAGIESEVAIARAVDAGGQPQWGPPVEVASLAELCALAARGGEASVAAARAEPHLLGAMQLGSWFDGGWRSRLARRALLRVPVPAALAGRVPRRLLWRTAVDAAFWRGVRRSASADEWQRWTASSFVALCYHRLVGEMKPGQEHLDVAPARLRSQARLLALLRFHPLSQDDLVAFYDGRRATLPRRAYAVTCDDAFADTVDPLRAIAAKHRPALFVPTACVGATAWFAGDEPIADWDTLAGSGLTIGSHARTHRPLPDLDDAELADELERSGDELRAHLRPEPTLAYPHGRHDARVRLATRDAGWKLAFTTNPGRNGAGTDRWCLRRIGVHQADGRLAFLWKVLTGELVPRRALWLGRLARPRRA